MTTRIAATWIALAAVADFAAAQSTVRANADSAGTLSAGGSNGGALNDDGTIVAFSSSAADLVSGDTNGFADVFVRDLAAGTTQRASVDSSGNESDGPSKLASLSADGLVVAFVSSATNLVAGDTNAVADIFVRDLQTGTTVRASVDSAGAQANGASSDLSLARNGRFVAFVSSATNLVLGDTNGADDVFVRDLQAGTTERASVDSSGTQANYACKHCAVSSDGRFVAFVSVASNLVSGDTNNAGDVFLHDRSNGTTERVSVDSAGTQGNAGSAFITTTSVSSDGRFVVFDSDASNLVTNDTNKSTDAFLRDRTLGTTERVSVDSNGGQGNRSSLEPSVSSDGRFVAFWGPVSTLVPADTNGVADVFIRDRESGATSRASVDSVGNQSDASSMTAAISGNGRCVAFSSAADNLVANDTNGASDVFVRDQGPFVPLLTSVTPSRGDHDATTPITIRGANFLASALIDVQVDGQSATNVTAVDDTTITCIAPAGPPGPATVSVLTQDGSGDLVGGFTYTPSVRWSGDATPGGSVAIDYLCDPLDGIFAIAGIPPAVAIPTPPYLGNLCIAPFTVLFLLPPGIWPFDDFTLKATIPADPSLSGATVLLQALTGPSFKKPKNASWTDCAAMTIQ